MNKTIVKAAAELVKQGHGELATELLAEETTAASKKIKKLQKIVKEHQATKVEGVEIDVQTANFMLQIWEGLNPKNQKKFESMDIKEMIDTTYKLMKKLT